MKYIEVSVTRIKRDFDFKCFVLPVLGSVPTD